MGKETGISWTDATWNPIRGCTRVSEGCRNCYAEGVARRFSGPGLAYEGLVRIDSSGKPREWNGNIKFVEAHLLDPLKWKEPKRIFVNSMSDLFHENVKDEWIDKIFAVMALTPWHTYQILTKRERMLAYTQRPDWYDRLLEAANSIRAGKGKLCGIPISNPARFPLRNVHFGVSCEDQDAADKRIPWLLQTPAAVRFISAEPLLGPLDLFRIGEPTGFHFNALSRKEGIGFRSTGLDWVIVGGESGPGARPCNTDWVQNVVDQCKAARVPVFVKQLGAHVIQGGERRIKKDKMGGDPNEWPHEIRVREFPSTLPASTQHH